MPVENPDLSERSGSYAYFTIPFCSWSFFLALISNLEPATSAVTANQKPVTYWNQGERMAPFSALRNDWEPLLHPYRTHDLCPVNLCPNCGLPRDVDWRGQNLTTSIY
jgi:hypothetical protein